jgi:hypothetical protein
MADREKDPLEYVVPESFGRAGAGLYLGDPQVVTEQVAAFCMSFEAALRAKEFGELTGEQFVENMKALVREQADIFSGREGEHQIIEGYHDITLPAKLRADLGDFWVKRHAAWDEDAIAVLFEWLATIIADKLKTAQGDEMLYEIMLKPSVQYVVHVLLGTEERAS